MRIFKIKFKLSKLWIMKMQVDKQIIDNIPQIIAEVKWVPITQFPMIRPFIKLKKCPQVNPNREKMKEIKLARCRSRRINHPSRKNVSENRTASNKGNQMTLISISPKLVIAKINTVVIGKRRKYSGIFLKNKVIIICPQVALTIRLQQEKIID